MKVVKLREGYRIKCSNGEFDGLCWLIHHGKAEATKRENHAHLTRPAKAFLRKKQTKSEAGPLMVTEDRRDGFYRMKKKGDV